MVQNGLQVVQHFVSIAYHERLAQDVLSDDFFEFGDAKIPCTAKKDPKPTTVENL